VEPLDAPGEEFRAKSVILCAQAMESAHSCVTLRHGIFEGWPTRAVGWSLLMERRWGAAQCRVLCPYGRFVPSETSLQRAQTDLLPRFRTTPSTKKDLPVYPRLWLPGRGGAESTSGGRRAMERRSRGAVKAGFYSLGLGAFGESSRAGTTYVEIASQS